MHEIKQKQIPAGANVQLPDRLKYRPIGRLNTKESASSSRWPTTTRPDTPAMVHWQTTVGTVTIATGVVGNTQTTTGITFIDMPAQGCGTTLNDVADHEALLLGGWILRLISNCIAAKNVSQLWFWRVIYLDSDWLGADYRTHERPNLSKKCPSGGCSRLGIRTYVRAT